MASLRETALPLIIATRGARSWAEVLETYQKCCGYLKGIYTPSCAELRHGLAQMPNSWSTALFYYSVVKNICGDRKPDYAVAALAIKQFKQGGHLNGMKRVFDEDINAHTIQGAQATLVLASFMGMWEKALQLMTQHPTLGNSHGNRRLLIAALCSANRVREAMQELRRGTVAGASPGLIRPIVKRLSASGKHQEALRLTASVLASGHRLSPSLFSALLLTLRGTHQWKEALESAQDLELLSTPRLAVQKNVATFNRLVDCLYDADPYGDCTVEEVVREMTSRMHPKDIHFRLAGKQRQFHLKTQSEMSKHLVSYAMSLSDLYMKALSLPCWYTRSPSLLVDQALTSGTVLLVLDANILIQCVTKNLPLEHFYHNMKKQHPRLGTDRYDLATVVVPFTAAQEVYSVIWDSFNRLQYAVRLLLWSRVLSLLRMPNVCVLSLPVELQTASMSMPTSMAYHKVRTDTAAVHQHLDPDRRILNVCLYLQYVLRCKVVTALNGANIPEGSLLFSFLKYHVRRFNNNVKGSASDKLILCTMDKKLARVAHEAGIDCFPLW